MVYIDYVMKSLYVVYNLKHILAAIRYALPNGRSRSNHTFFSLEACGPA